ncbi:hypothetical protein BUALT_Bualt15G0135700 [Buddleja alternifolia]|uniref:Uncharacterized protein n=1 Tax=Buddleja alternifolia TaxID=168488 RepID=A0AAV6WNZ4_9LAMI|nr:hypothetical protein BUALT_Bualt15G0135700 [Buddleja alternifolia]
MEQFEAYFQRADLDRDGRISGAEAVGFLQGSNLPKQVLAQIWTYADQNHTGYLSRPEFYNALKLVTVAQSKRELTPDIVKAALYGHASAKIPAPQINLAAIPAPQPNLGTPAPSPQTGAPSLPSSQTFGFRGQAPSSTSVNQQYGPTSSTTGMNQQFRQVQPSITGINQQFGQVRPSVTGMNQQFGQVQPSNTNMNWQFGQAQPSSTGMSQQFGQAPPSANTNQRFIPSQGNQSMRPPLSVPTGAVSRPPRVAGSLNSPGGGSMVGPGVPNSNTDWLGGKTSAVSTGPVTNVLNKGGSPLDQLAAFSSTAARDPKGLVGSGRGSTSDPMFGGDMFSANPSSSQQVSSAPLHRASSLPTSSAIVPITSSPQPSAKPDPFEALQSTLAKPSTGFQAPQTPSLPKSNQQVPTQVTSSISLSGVPPGSGSSTSEQSQISWPKMTRASIQKYAKVFMEVDTDRDGKITGLEARNLFLSWRLPREVLKQVWDLSDQDGDSMLSLREFCIALYLMERYREGQTLPSTLPNSVMLDETLLSLAGPPTAYGNMGWAPTSGTDLTCYSGIRPPQQGLPAGQPPMQLQPDGSTQFNQEIARDPAIDISHTNQLSNGQDNPLSTKGQDAAGTNEKVENNENVLLDSREKLEFYRTKMQDLVLYKSRCDNRLNEITERARADKGEAELLDKKYQEKYKQERKMELHQALTKMEQGGSADGILQVRADRIQSDLEELLKALTERCKKHALQMKSSALIELPPGWTPGIPEAAAIWDEDWDKFEDEGFSFDVAVPANGKSASVERENSSPTPSFSPDSVINADATSKKPFSEMASAFETESVYSADESKSPRGSPGRQTTYESPREYSDNHFGKSSDGDAETHRNFDESAWGNFDNNDDIDSVWGFNTKASSPSCMLACIMFMGLKCLLTLCILLIEDPDHGKHEDKYFFGSNDFSASPERSYSPQADNAFQKNSPFNYEDSIPGSPLSRAGNSPPRYSTESRDPFADSFSRFDSFTTHDRGDSSNLTRFDSINSTKGFDQSSRYSFDDSDPFGSTGPFKVSSETPKKGSDWSSF